MRKGVECQGSFRTTALQLVKVPDGQHFDEDTQMSHSMVFSADEWQKE